MLESENPLAPHRGGLKKKGRQAPLEYDFGFASRSPSLSSFVV